MVSVEATKKKIVIKIRLLLGLAVYLDGQKVVGLLKNKRGERIISYCFKRDKFYEDNICWL